ncbi:hypothetical protein PR048_015250 [Dryococelus australis]|uniref:Splicing factor Cactin C-terminal domain-containing protein n=1 Tax=Dryococelus australis TaxID=614101 RepID=A0ABQ9HGE3_9NEOP|nr:hypothetical protein PR048_015250 [Dryococelus australis]
MSSDEVRSRPRGAAHMARARLRDRHQDNLRRKLEVLKAQQGVAATAQNPDEIEIKEESQPQSESDEDDTASEKEEQAEEEEEESQGDQAARAMLSESFADYESGGYSPQYLSSSQLDPGTIITTEEDDLQRLEYARKQVQGTGSRVENVVAVEEQALLREARKGMTGEEAEFSVESALDNQVYLWSDKYRPRKPRYFNRTLWMMSASRICELEAAKEDLARMQEVRPTISGHTRGCCPDRVFLIQRTSALPGGGGGAVTPAKLSLSIISPAGGAASTAWVEGRVEVGHLPQGQTMHGSRKVHTGFEWNKYNQTHYDMDNPPPKIVQGYKFNIFYPDLIDKGTTPEYFLGIGLSLIHEGPVHQSGLLTSCDGIKHLEAQYAELSSDRT